MSDTDWDVDFFFDPVCPFAWQTSRWLRRVAELRTLNVNWRFICLRIINEDRDYAAEFPPNYGEAHGRGRSLLRVCAAVREAVGPEPIGAMYEAFGNELWSRRPSETSFSGVMAAPIYQVNPLMGSQLIIVVFAVVVIGGMGSIAGAILTGLGLGLVEGLTKVVYPEASAVVIFVIMIFVLLFRPAGLFGKQA